MALLLNFYELPQNYFVPIPFGKFLCSISQLVSFPACAAHFMQPPLFTQDREANQALLEESKLMEHGLCPNNLHLDICGEIKLAYSGHSRFRGPILVALCAVVRTFCGPHRRELKHWMRLTKSGAVHVSRQHWTSVLFMTLDDPLNTGNLRKQKLLVGLGEQ